MKQDNLNLFEKKIRKVILLARADKKFLVAPGISKEISNFIKKNSFRNKKINSQEENTFVVEGDDLRLLIFPEN